MKQGGGLVALVCLLVVLCSQTQAEIRLVEAITVLEEVVDNETLVLTDIDTTLMESAVSLGWSQWWQHVRQALQRNGLEKATVLPILNPMVGWIMQHIPMKPMESCTAEVVANIQNRGITILALTARHQRAPFCPHFDWVTRKHLRDMGIDFRRSCLPDGIKASDEEFVAWGYHEGVIYTNGQQKGPSLMAFLRHHGYRPSRVVLIDDRLDMLESVEEVLQQEGIPFLGLHYVREEPPFHLAAANVQWHSLLTTGFVPTDEEALAMFAQGPKRSPDFFLECIIEHMKAILLSVHH